MSLHWNPKSRIPETAQAEGEFLESTLPVKSFVHLTTCHKISSEHLKSTFRSWILGIQKHHQMTVGWVRSIENFPKLHIHVALIAVHPIDSEYAASLWEKLASPGYTEAAKVEPYLVGRCGLGYVLKQLCSPSGEIEYSDNITAFSSRPVISRFPTTPRQRRQQRRVQGQIAKADTLQAKGHGNEDNSHT